MGCVEVRVVPDLDSRYFVVTYFGQGKRCRWRYSAIRVGLAQISVPGDTDRLLANHGAAFTY